MTVKEDRTAVSDESTGRTAEDVLDVLLEALRADQGGARTSAIQRALASADDDRIARLESIVESLANRLEELEGRESGTAGAALADRLDELEASIDDLDERLAAVAASTRTVEAELADVRESIGAVDPDDDPPETPPDGHEDDVHRQLEHVESKLDARTSALASRIEAVDALDRRLDDVEARTDALSADVDDVNETLEKAVTIVQEEMQDEIASVRSSIESLEDDVDTLEWHAVHTSQWRESVEDALDGAGVRIETEDE